MIWPAALEEYQIDLNPYLEKEATAHFPMLADNYTVNGKLVALPYHASTGVLFYRTELLKKYGYRKPPRTWPDLEAKGNGWNAVFFSALGGTPMSGAPKQNGIG
jgi:trehalose/maltose transport system substrate-binding protein